MTGAMTGFLVAVGAGSVAGSLMRRRLQGRRARGGPSRGGTDGDAGSYTGDHGFAVASWFVTHHSATDGSGNPIVGGCVDIGGGVLRGVGTAGVGVFKVVCLPSAGRAPFDLPQQPQLGSILDLRNQPGISAPVW